MNNQIPNLITALNLACGMFAINYVMSQEPAIEPVIIYVGWALVFDFLDGMVARLLGVSSPIGKQLDSLADVVTFGVVPGLVMFKLIDEPFICYAGFVITIFSAYRLAKFNVDPRQSDSFFGLPTPANTILILSFWAIRVFEPDSIFAGPLQNNNVLVGLCLLSALLMNLDVRLIALKFKSLDLGPNKFRYLLVLSSVALLFLLHFTAVPVIIVLYFVLSFVENASETSR